MPTGEGLPGSDFGQDRHQHLANLNSGEAGNSLFLSSCITLGNSFYSQGLLALPEDRSLELCEVLQVLGFLLLALSLSTMQVSWIPSDGTASPCLTTQSVSLNLHSTGKILLFLPILPLFFPT